MQGRRHLVLVPYPLQGHITPMLQLASFLHSKGFSISIAHTISNAPNPSSFPSFNFLPIEDGLTQDDILTKKAIELLPIINNNCLVTFRDVLGRYLLMLNRGQENVPCIIISDAVMHFTSSVADHFKLPRIVLRTNSASSFIPYMAFPLLRQMGYFPIQDPQSDKLVMELPPLRVKDLPYFTATNPDKLYDMVTHMVNDTKSSSGVIWNSIRSLEQHALTKIHQELQTPNFVVGPLHKYSSGSSSSLLAHDETCMAWLDKQTIGSVLYVSFGSLACIDRAGLLETAWGLANSGLPFLWVIRPGSVDTDRVNVKLPEEFEKRIEGRGLIVKWAPQEQVLAHPAVAGFWTHNGWNSTLESICEGVPMLCWPQFGDQKVNARYVSHVWKVGLQLENGLERGDIERAIKRLMVGKEADDMRGRIKLLKEESIRSTEKGGSSYEFLEKLVNYILSF